MSWLSSIATNYLTPAFSWLVDSAVDGITGNAVKGATSLGFGLVGSGIKKVFGDKDVTEGEKYIGEKVDDSGRFTIGAKSAKRFNRDSGSTLPKDQLDEPFADEKWVSRPMPSKAWLTEMKRRHGEAHYDSLDPYGVTPT